MKKVSALLALALASVALVACGGGGDNGSTSTGGETSAETTSESTTGGAANAGKEAGGTAETVEFEADPEGSLAYTTTEATAKAGKVEVEFNNPQALTHDVAIEDSSGKEVGKTELIASGSDSTTVDLKPGSYTFFCTVPGHREAGMEGTLTVE